MLICVLVSALLLGLSLPYEADSWPLDEAVVQNVREYGSRHYGPDWGLRDAVEHEQRSFLRADVVVIGVSVGDGPTVVSRYGPCVTALFETEECLKGDCPDTLSLARNPEAVRVFFNVALGARPLDWTSPQPGSRYLLLGRSDSEDPGFLWGGFGHNRYELRDGLVAGKAVPEDEFLAAVTRLLGAAARSEDSPQEGGTLGVQPPN
jgi:hypothetical protein